MEGSGKWMRLNVGGVHFVTTRQTLRREANSFLARLADQSQLDTDKDDSGSYLIDRDGEYFRSVLNYLRHGRLIVDHGLSLQGVLEEAEFYNLPRLIMLCKEEMEVTSAAAPKATRHVYRVLPPCNEDELTQAVSSISDGWQLLQLLHLSTAEYVCIVSRECPELAPPIGRRPDRDPAALP